MSNTLSNALKSEMFGPSSSVPFITLFTLTHPSFANTIRIVNNTESVSSNGNTFESFPVKVVLPADDNETVREVQIQFDNVSLELIDEFRGVTSPIDVKIQMVLSDNPNFIQYELEDLKLKSISYNAQTITAKLVMDDFLSSGLTSERYTPSNFPGIF